MSVTDFEKSRKYRENREADASRTINEYRHRNRLLTIELDKARQTIKDMSMLITARVRRNTPNWSASVADERAA